MNGPRKVDITEAEAATRFTKHSLRSFPLLPTHKYPRVSGKVHRLELLGLRSLPPLPTSLYSETAGVKSNSSPQYNPSAGLQSSLALPYHPVYPGKTS